MTTPDRLTNEASPPCDLLTVAAIGLMVYALSTIIHEGLGHGGACLLVGGRPRVLTSMMFSGDQTGLAPWTHRCVAACGTIANLLAVGISLLFLRRPPGSVPAHYFLWLFATVNLLVGTGYFLFSGFSNIGDWANVIAGLRGHWLWRVLLIVGGWTTYVLCLWFMLMKAHRLFGGEIPNRYRRANLMMLTPYFVGGALSLLAGMLDPAAKALLIISGMAASFGGTSGLVWGPQLLRDGWLPTAPVAPAPLERSWPWIIGGLVVSAAFVFVLGPGVKF